MSTGTALECRDVHKAFGKTQVLTNINLRIARGQIVGLVGPSGCGKSTLLNMIVGTHKPTSGAILVEKNGNLVEVQGHGPDRGMVYQHYSLYPHLSVLENVAIGLMFHETTIPGRLFGLDAESWPALRKKHLEQAQALLVRFGLEEHLGKYPHPLSGGQQQRVAIARALIMKPEILLLDEPFGALDQERRHEARRVILNLYKENLKAVQAGLRPPFTIIMVTHELEEAVHVGDRVIGLSKNWRGREQAGAMIVYDKPAPVFTGEESIRDGRIPAQAEEIYDVVFRGSDLDPQEHCTFWNCVQTGHAYGVLAR